MFQYLDASEKSSIAASYVCRFLMEQLLKCEVYTDDNDISYCIIPKKLMNTYQQLRLLISEYLKGTHDIIEPDTVIGTIDKGVIMESPDNFMAKKEYKDKLYERINFIAHIVDHDFEINKQQFTYQNYEYDRSPYGKVKILKHINAWEFRQEDQPIPPHGLVHATMFRILEDGPNSVVML